VDVEVDAAHVDSAQSLFATLKNKCFIGASLQHEPIIEAQVSGAGGQKSSLKPIGNPDGAMP
jgi:hypothetical protein